ncbi:MAG TPA: T9SS type A sorting domain-containing protein [Bacteroidales bacterium]|nr:T9SS type A sorting domain-containing protein [Bacteroidales bacterium]HSA42064.1 T9SS type A sorting domain-containing protein [Bacteroidales bacterium]
MKKFYLFIIPLLFCVGPGSYGQWSYTNLSAPKAYMGVASLGSKVYFAGGMNDSGLKSTVEIYDFSTGLWDTTQHLSVARDLVTATTCGSKVLFAGGVDFFSSSNVYATVDIYDTLTNQWSVHQLSAARLNITALSFGNKVLFAGGANTQLQAFDNIDIYNCATDTWSVEYLPVPRFTYGGVVNNLGILPGGYDSTGGVTKRVDIYNFTTGTWSVDSLSVARAWVGVTTIGDKMLIAGGATHDAIQSNVVDIYDASTGIWTDTTLSIARSFCDNQNVVNVCGKAYFIGGGKMNLNGPYWEAAYNQIDIYDLTTNTWSVDNIPTITATVHRAAASIGDQFIIAGGIWGSYSSNAEIYSCINTNVEIIPEKNLIIYPNPSTELITISLPENSLPGHLSIINPIGQEVLQQTITNSFAHIDIREMPTGIYFAKVICGNKIHTVKIIKE